MPKIGMASCAMMATRWMRPLRVAAENGFDAFEISCVFPSAEPENTPPEIIDKAKDILEESGMEVCVHAPFMELNIGAFSKGIRDESIRSINKAVDMCEAIGGEVFIVHSGTLSYDQLRGATKDNHPLVKMQWDYNIESLKQINDYANKKGITVCLENIGFNCLDQTFEDLLEMREAVGSSLQFTLDFGHARLAQGGEKAISLLRENIRHIHLTDNHGENDDHLPVGEGNYDYSKFLDYFRSFPHIITLETVDLTTDPNPVLKGYENFKKML